MHIEDCCTESLTSVWGFPYYLGLNHVGLTNRKLAATEIVSRKHGKKRCLLSSSASTTMDVLIVIVIVLLRTDIVVVVVVVIAFPTSPALSRCVCGTAEFFNWA